VVSHVLAVRRWAVVRLVLIRGGPFMRAVEMRNGGPFFVDKETDLA
jgi:hypothetical protein